MHGKRAEALEKDSQRKWRSADIWTTVRKDFLISVRPGMERKETSII